MSDQGTAGGGLLGQAALRQGWISSEQLQQAVGEQSVSPAGTQLGELLVKKGWINLEQLRKLLQVQAQEREHAKDSPRAGYTGSTGAVQSVPAGRTKYELDGLLAKAVAAGAGDFHLHSGGAMYARIHGELRMASSAPTSSERASQLLEPILSRDQLATLRSKGEVDFAYDLGPVGRFRANVYRQHCGLSGVFRHIAPVAPTLEQLGLSTDIARFANFFQGLVLITGPTGSGKSSTLAALVELINGERSEHILCVEDPVEFVFESKQCTVNQRQVEQHTETFASALRGALREDPDVIVIGELRDQETIALALTAAETGHLVLATMTTSNAVGTIERLIGAFPSKRQSQVRSMVSESLRGVISQRLLPRSDTPGRVLALELLFLDQAVSNLIRDEKTFQIESVLQTGSSRGMRMMDVSIAELLKQGLIDRDTAQAAADDPKKFAPMKPRAHSEPAG